MSRARAIVFLGPSLPLAEARRILPGARFHGPAKQGDVLRALRDRPRVLALVDGVFETQRSVWHAELRIALAQGVRVLGASSMGALRAVELAPFGMEGVGEVFRAYATGRLVDDADVALLHADAAHGHRALTLPYVNVLAAADRAVARRVLSPAEGRALVRGARALNFADRDWEGVLALVRWKPAVRARFGAFLQANPCDVKADDARVCLVRARELCRRTPAAPRELGTLSTWARRAWVDAQGPMPQRPGGNGLRTLLLAEWGRSLGLEPDARRVAQLERRLVQVDPLLRRTWASAIALEEIILAHPELLLAQAPSGSEGRWVEAMKRASRRSARQAFIGRTSRRSRS